MENVDCTFSTHNGDLSDREGEHAVSTEVLAVHGDVCATVSLAEDERHARHCSFGVCKEELCAVADNAVVFLLRARHVTRNVDEREDRNVEAVAEANEACGLVAGVHVQRTGEALRLVSDDTHDITFEACKTDNNVLCEFRLDFEEGILVGKASDHVANVVSALEVVRNDFFDVERTVDDFASLFGSLFGIVLREVAEQVTDAFEASLVVLVHKVSNARLREMNASATELIRGHDFCSHGLHDTWARDEHLARLFCHEDKVGNSRGVASTTCARSENHGNLRDDTASPCIASKDATVTVEGANAFFDTCATAVVDADERHSGFEGEVHHFANLLGMSRTEGTAAYREVLGACVNRAAIDLTVTRYDAVTIEALGIRELDALGNAQSADFFECSLIEKDFKAFASCEFALCVLLFYTSGAATGLCLGVAFAQLF